MRKTINIAMLLVLAGWGTVAGALVMQERQPMSPLDKALQSAKSDQSKSDEFYGLLLRTDVFVPVLDRESTSPDSFAPVVLSRDDKKFIPFFDSLDRLREWAKREIGYVRMSGIDFLRVIFAAAMTDDSVRLVLNLATAHYKEFVRGEVQEVLDWARSSSPVADKIEKDTKAYVGAPAKVTDGLEMAISRCLNKYREVKAAYLGQIYVPGIDQKPRLLVVVQTDSTDQNAFRALLDEVGLAIHRLLATGPSLDIMRDDGNSTAAAIVRQVKPFYVRSR